MATDPTSFETAFAQLEDTVGILEQGGLTLETAVARFEEGMRLAAQCGAILDEAELRITRLLADDGELEDEPAF
jgi:exodeoxyribonuclease VII small subunit